MNPRPQSAASDLDRPSEFSASGSVYESDYPGPNRSGLINATAILWRDRKQLRNLTLAGGTLTLLVVLLVPNTYDSTVRLMGSDAHNGSQMAMLATVLGKADGTINRLASDFLGGGSQNEAVMGVLRSRTVAQHIVDKFNLKRVYWIRKDSDARDKLAERTGVSEDRKTGIISITVTDRDPHRAADMARAYVDELNSLLNLVNTSAAHRQRIFIEQRLKEVRDELADASVKLRDFSTKNSTLDPKEQGKAMVGAVVTLQGELIAIQTELKGLEQVYSVNNVRVRSAKARIAELQRRLQEFHGNDSNLTPDTGDDLEYPTIKELPGLGLTYGDLYRDLKLHEAVFETLTAQYELARIEEAKEIPTVKVLDPADVPDKKSGPPRAIITALGLLMSFCLASVWLVGRTLWKDIDRHDPRKQLALEVWEDTRPLYSRLQARLHRERNGSAARSADAAD
jgi:uncharacterized protein involved in exopolysaccharide biosynthesis